MTIKAIFLAAALLGAASAAAGEMLLEDGAYRVDVRLELPHLEDMAATKSVTICVSRQQDGGNHGLVVLSDNNPLAHCPTSNVRSDGDKLTFDISCAGVNSARGTAHYTLGLSGFTGRIAMKMGGKNMTMTETQHGSRIGECASAVPPRF